VTTQTTQPAERLREFVFAQGLAARHDDVRWESLTGGVSSDIWKVDVLGGPICVKAALPKLKVARDWRAPVDRNVHEWDWLCFAHALRPGVVPRPVAHDPDLGAFAMEFLDPHEHHVWKQLLMSGDIRETVAREVAQLLVFLHRSSAGRPDLREQFATTDAFYALRLEPYLVATAQRHPSVRPRLERMVEELSSSSIGLVHGDVSPKNILIGPRAPVFLDAECAWYGDPAFDVAFCLNHFLLKCLVRKGDTALYLKSFDAFAHTYLKLVDWEDRGALERRIANLLPALFLARVDGKSPVEYIDSDSDRDLVRMTALALLNQDGGNLFEVRRQWQDCLRQHEDLER
jgi:hypothetical protein